MQLSELNAHRHTAATRFGEISYLDLGAGPTALFVHGIATNAYLWRHVMDALSGQRRCIAIDLPLHGQSPPRPLQETQRDRATLPQTQRLPPHLLAI